MTQLVTHRSSVVVQARRLHAQPGRPRHKARHAGVPDADRTSSPAVIPTGQSKPLIDTTMRSGHQGYGKCIVQAIMSPDSKSSSKTNGIPAMIPTVPKVVPDSPSRTPPGAPTKSTR